MPCGFCETILMLWNSCAVGYLLPSLQTLHGITTKSISIFSDVVIHKVVWYVIKQKRWRNEIAVLPSLEEIFMLLLITKTFALFVQLYAQV